jgi:hypothetical protein
VSLQEWNDPKDQEALTPSASTSGGAMHDVDDEEDYLSAAFVEFRRRLAANDPR